MWALTQTEYFEQINQMRIQKTAPQHQVPFLLLMQEIVSILLLQRNRSARKV